ncbi:hypothetical protein AMJ50_01080 [Parcubacteria bacterium DG_74_3]|nr:MAG: hypothetical protein AMJ50_01080 [Parcubacteria bacterium DG_74_3]
MDKAPRFPIDPYKQRLFRAIAQIYQRYENLGLEIAPGQYRVNQEKEAFCLLEDKIVLFQIIDEPELLKELNPDALATAQQTAEGKFVIILQKILFEMNSAILPIVLQQELDEIVLGLGGTSLRDCSIRDQQEQDRKIIQTALKRQLNLKLLKLENIPQKRIVVLTSAPGNSVYSRQQMP